MQATFDFGTGSNALLTSFPNPTRASPKDPEYLSIVVL